MDIDKIADQISDAILDACMEQDPFSKVACETAVTTGLVLVLGEITTHANIDYQAIIRNKIKEIGYDDSSKGNTGIIALFTIDFRIRLQNMRCDCSNSEAKPRHFSKSYSTW